ncbi:MULTISPECIES: VOC family protein [Pseudoalteromonas]|uniref:Glyoxalase n=1 Tax=Pseudoalteromonas amylolytica TaxID=1859457 RepID=A0A1S1MN64_9GAMM|nr:MULTISPECIES: VOC family protein [Pseudoalteromonas]OHU86038.1 glyoxalase [Pseudoalteromonas sp. JW3]OHU89853.1 glyoxalase [Pseudoalteromonas amylolytica]
MSRLTYAHIHEFCWAELCAADWRIAKPFYCALFGWEFDDERGANGDFYTNFKKQDDIISGMYEMGDEKKSARVQSVWQAYVAVMNVDASVAYAEKLGGKLVRGPYDIGEAGRMAVISDPSGAQLTLWQAKQHIGSRRAFEANTPYWHELACRNSKQNEAFYAQLFGWHSIHQTVEGLEYAIFSNDEHALAGMVEMTEAWSPTVPSHWMMYFAVLDCDAVAKKAAGLGAKVCVPPKDIPEVGRYAVICDPQGAFFSIIESKMDTITP